MTAALTGAEARTLRPDPLLVLFLCVALWGVVRVVRSGAADEGREESPSLMGVAAIWTGVGLGVMTKGMHGVLPWHVAAGWVNHGFWWDYVVNQHLLFFFDRVPPTYLRQDVSRLFVKRDWFRQEWGRGTVVSSSLLIRDFPSTVRGSFLARRGRWAGATACFLPTSPSILSRRPLVRRSVSAGNVSA